MTARLLVTATLLGILFAGVSGASVSYNTFNGVYSQDFNTLATGNGAYTTWTNDSTIPGWYAMHGGTYTSFTQYLANDGSSVTHILQSLGVSGNSDRALGCMSYNDNTIWGLRLTNNTGSTMTEFTLSYTGEQWRDQSTVAVAFAYSTSASSLDGSGFTGVSALNFNPPWNSNLYTMNGNLAANRRSYSQIVIMPSGWAAGSDLWLRWSTGPNQGSGVGIDDLSFSAVPEPATLSLLALSGLALLRRRK